LVTHMQEDASVRRAVLTAALVQRVFTPAEVNAVIIADADQQANLREFQLAASPAQLQLMNRSGAGPLSYQAASYQQQALPQGPSGSLAHDPTTADDWYGSMTHVIRDQMGTVERNLVGQVITRATSLRNSAVTVAIITGLAVLLVLALALFF